MNLTNEELKNNLKLINEDIEKVKERIELKKRISEAKKERFLLKLGLKK